MENKSFKIGFLLLCLTWFSHQTKGQWLSNENYRLGRKILKAHELSDSSVFVNVPEVDTALLNRAARKYESEKRMVGRLAQKLMAPLPVHRYRRELPPDTLSETDKKLFLQKRDSDNETLASAISEKISACWNLSLQPPTTWAFLQGDRDQISEILQRVLYTDSLSAEPLLYETLAMLATKPSIKKQLLNGSQISVRARAKLGDLKAENEIIHRFNSYIKDSIILSLDSINAVIDDLLLVSTNGTLETFFKELNATHAVYIAHEKIDKRQPYSVYSVPFLLLLRYNRLHFSELYFFEKYIYQNNAIIPAMRPILYFTCVSEYLSNRYDRKVRIGATYDMRTVIY